MHGEIHLESELLVCSRSSFAKLMECAPDDASLRKWRGLCLPAAGLSSRSTKALIDWPVSGQLLAFEHSAEILRGGEECVSHEAEACKGTLACFLVTGAAGVRYEYR